MLRQILPLAVAVAETCGDVSPDTLWADERAAVATAVSSRLQEYATTRHCARLALAELGAPVGSILRGDRGVPLWPTGVIGSLTHCRGYRGAAVAWQARVVSGALRRGGGAVAWLGSVVRHGGGGVGRGVDTDWLDAEKDSWPDGERAVRLDGETDVRTNAGKKWSTEGGPGGVEMPAGMLPEGVETAPEGVEASPGAPALVGLGVDAEPVGSLAAGVLARISSAGEQRMIQELTSQDSSIPWNRLLFSAKESLYKAWFPLTGIGLNFHQASIKIEPPTDLSSERSGQFAVSFQRDLPESVTELTWLGTWIVTDDLIHTAIQTYR